jgi:hypothetical protein
VKKRIKQLIDALDDIPLEFDKLRYDAVRLAFLEQDKLTRQACAYAVLRIQRHAAVTCLIGDAHAAVMNAKGGIE